MGYRIKYATDCIYRISTYRSVIPISQNSGFLVYKTNLLTIVEIKQGDLLKTSFVFKKYWFFLHSLLVISTAGSNQIPASVDQQNIYCRARVVIIVMVLITTISGAPTMFQVVDKMTYACYSCLLLGDPEVTMFFSRKLVFVGTMLLWAH